MNLIVLTTAHRTVNMNALFILYFSSRNFKDSHAKNFMIGRGESGNVVAIDPKCISK